MWVSTSRRDISAPQQGHTTVQCLHADTCALTCSCVPFTCQQTSKARAHTPPKTHASTPSKINKAKNLQSAINQQSSWSGESTNHGAWYKWAKLPMKQLSSVWCTSTGALSRAWHAPHSLIPGKHRTFSCLACTALSRSCHAPHFLVPAIHRTFSFLSYTALSRAYHAPQFLVPAMHRTLSFLPFTALSRSWHTPHSRTSNHFSLHATPQVKR
jgi:hypothetical protein